MFVLTSFITDDFFKTNPYNEIAESKDILRSHCKIFNWYHLIALRNFLNSIPPLA